jgi:hypothetical protein
MSLSGGRDLLSGALKTLRGHWENTEPHWQDAMKAQFVEQILTPLEDQCGAALQAIDRMDVLLQQMRRDCEGNSFDIYGGSGE